MNVSERRFIKWVFPVCVLVAKGAAAQPVRAVDVNDSGQVVGYCSTENFEDRAFSWTPTGGMVDLGLGRAHAVNDKGQVVGTSRTAGDAIGVHAFSWTPAGPSKATVRVKLLP
jgi:probable HAF family extracellular repeat protein